MSFVKDVLVEEYILLSERLQVCRREMEFIEKAFSANDINLTEEINSFENRDAKVEAEENF